MDETQVPTDTQGATAAPDVAATQLMDTQMHAPSGWGANVQPVVGDDDATQAPEDYDDDATQAPEDYDDDATQAP